MTPATNPLLTDFYQLSMIEAYLEHAETKAAVFEFYVRTLPPQRNFLICAGLEQAVSFLENLHFSPEEIEWLARCGGFGKTLLAFLAQLRFTGDVHAMPEGEAFFANEPILRVTAPLPQAQLVETRLINLLHFQCLIASKAARLVLAAGGKPLVDFGLRRAHGAEAGLFAARASFVAGFAGTATLLAGKLYGIPLFGTMAHSFIEVHDDETSAFEHFARARPDGVVLLIDTYDTEAAARKVVALAPRLQEMGIKVKGVRLDSGDLISLSKTVRQILNDGGLEDVTLFASGGLNEHELLIAAQADAPIDAFGIGTNLTTSFDAPALDCAYKLQEYAGQARRKLSSGKQTWPGRKQVWRRFSSDGRMAGDILSLEDDDQQGTPLVRPVMQGGRRLHDPETLTEIRARAADNIRALPEPLRNLRQGAGYPVAVADRLVRLAAKVDRQI